MGLRINAEVETNRGPTTELYFRIENWKVNLTLGQIRYTTTCWLSKKYADQFLREYYDEPLKNSVGLVSSKLVYYNDDIKDGKELDIPNSHTMYMYEEKEIEVPIYEEKEVSKELPYISFDENGEEITLYRTVKQKEDVLVRTESVTKKVMDYSVNNLEEVTYKNFKQFLQNEFLEEHIEQI